MLESRLFIATLGFHEDVVLRILNKYYAGAGDVIKVFTLHPAAGAAKKAFEYLRTDLIKLGISNDNIKLIEVPEGDMVESLSLFINEISESGEKPEEIIFCLGGGSRIVVVPATIASMIISLSGIKVKISITSEAYTGGITEASADWFSIPAFISEQRIRLLEAIGNNEGANIAKISNILGQKEKTIKNRISELKPVSYTHLRAHET
ncbi:MAG: CRISPR-associated CARF protein Csa3, partial [Caldisphaeraceae archaeon]|nr:CRISPR-associated CARF protein Csa3 [Caldisphaeraceae archaeon]